MRFKSAIMLIMLLMSGIMFGQIGSIVGKVTDSQTGEQLIGTNIVVVNQNIGATTDENGEYELTLPEGKYQVKFSYTGYTSTTMEVDVVSGKKTVLNVNLKQDVFKTEEVVVTGQGTGIERKRLSTVTTSISSEEIEKLPATRLEEVLQSALPNSQIKLRSGQAGGTANFNTRGAKSVLVSSMPVIYVDGIRVDNLNSAANLSLNLTGSTSQGSAIGAIADIPIENIDRIEYINGGAATTLYGSDAANGVIQIFTKQGSAHQSTFSVEANTGVDVATEDYLFYDRTGDLLYTPGFVQEYTIAGSGGSEGLTYSFGGSFNDREGHRIANSASREYSLRTTFGAQLAKKVRLVSSFGFSRNEYERMRGGNAGTYAPLYLFEGTYLPVIFPQFSSELDEMSDEMYNDLKDWVKTAEELQDYNYTVNRFQTSQKVEYSPLPNLKLHAIGGLDYRESIESGIITTEYLTHMSSSNTAGSISQYERSAISLTLEAAGSYTYETKDLSIISSLGTQLFRYEDDQTAVMGEEIRDGAKTVSGAGSTSSNQYKSSNVNYGVFFLQNFGYMDRIFLEYGIRADGNSAFGDNVGTQYFPKVGLSFVLSECDWYSNSYLPYLRLRANYGVAGNFPPAFLSEKTVNFNPYLDELTATMGEAGNPDLKAEKTYTSEFGADFSVLNNNLLAVSLTYYNAVTKDALFSVPTAPSEGQGNIIKNIGEIENKGWEITLTSKPVEEENFDLTLTASINTLDNKVVDAGGAAAFAIGGFSSRTVQAIVEEGQPVGYIRGTKAIVEGDSLVGTEELAYLGKTQPDAFGSLSLNIRLFKRINIYASADYQWGAQAHNFNRQFRYLRGTETDMVPEGAQGSSWLNYTNYFVEDTDFLKVRIISVGYSLPENWYTGIFNNVTVSYTVRNPFNFYSSSFDPEADGSGARSQGAVEGNGASYGVESAPRTHLFGLKFTM